jgi:serine/threonine-protein kinase
VHKDPPPPKAAAAVPPTGPVSTGGDTFDVEELIDNRYRVRKLLGEGATSRVYVADDTALDTTVAIKILRPSANRGRAFLRFEQEARVMISISHPNVARVFGFGRLKDGRPYLAMEFFLGKTLLGFLRQKRVVEPRLAYNLVQQLLAGLASCHALGIVHRDVKPSNIYLVQEGGSATLLKLIDFGLAKAPPNRAIVVTRPGHAFGTPGYAAPEVLSGGAASSKCDIWSTGVILFELLAGVRPFRDPTAELSAFAIACGPSRRLLDYVPSTPPAIVALIDAALAKNPDARIPSAEEFSRRLALITEDLGPPSTITPIQSSGSGVLESDRTLPVLDRTPIQSLLTETTSVDSPSSASSGARRLR